MDCTLYVFAEYRSRIVRLAIPHYAGELIPNAIQTAYDKAVRDFVCFRALCWDSSIRPNEYDCNAKFMPDDISKVRAYIAD